MEKRFALRVSERASLRFIDFEPPLDYQVRVVDVDARGIYLERPIIDRVHLRPAVGGRVKVAYCRRDAMYTFSSSILEFSVRDNWPVMLIAHPKNITRIQRREHFRVDLLSALTFLPVDSQPPGAEEPEPKRGWVLNLSAGGCRFTAEAADTIDLWRGSAVRIDLKLTDGQVLRDIGAVVLRVSPDRSDSTRSVVICRFTEITDEAREAIIVHNIRYQLKWRSQEREAL